MWAESKFFHEVLLSYSSVRSVACAGNEKTELIARDLALHIKRLDPKNTNKPGKIKN
jgi:hypothetical protein